MIDTNKYFYNKREHTDYADELNSYAARKGVQVSRWVNNSKSRQIVTYIVHEGERNQYASKQENALFSVNEDAGRGGTIYDETTMMNAVMNFLQGLPEVFTVVSELVGDSEPATFAQLVDVVAGWEPYDGWTLEVHDDGDEIRVYAYDATDEADIPNSFAMDWYRVRDDIFYHVLARRIEVVPAHGIEADNA